MRDVGILVWVVLVLVGVIGSIISSVRRQLPQQPARPRPRSLYTMTPEGLVRVPAPAAAPQPVNLSVASGVAERPPAKPRPAGELEPHLPAAVVPHAQRARLFGDRRSLVRAVIAAEVLGKPRAFGDEYARY